MPLEKYTILETDLMDFMKTCSCSSPSTDVLREEELCWYNSWFERRQFGWLIPFWETEDKIFSGIRQSWLNTSIVNVSSFLWITVNIFIYSSVWGYQYLGKGVELLRCVWYFLTLYTVEKPIRNLIFQTIVLNSEFYRSGLKLVLV